MDRESSPPHPDDLKTPLTLGDHQVPGVWRHLLPDDLQFMRWPSECQSTCSACPKVKEEGFHPDYRCCTYHPRIPNFLLGLALDDPDTAPLIEGVIAGRLATPEGLQATPVQMRQSLVLATSPRRDEAGVAQDSVVCRFLDKERRRCGVYKYRDSVCATFFCKHDQGDEGYDFWRKLQAVAGQSEAALSQWVMDELGMDVGAYIARFNGMAGDLAAHSEAAHQGWPIDTLKMLWGDWYGREAEFYRACAALVRDHRESLGTVLEQRTILAPSLYDQAFLDSLPGPLQREMLTNGVIGGEPVAISDLWYQFKLAHRNHWQPAD